MKWSSRSLGGRVQHGVFRLLVRLGAMAAARVLMRGVVLYYVLIPSVRRRIRPYLKRRFPGAGGAALFLHTWRLYLCFAEVILSRIELRAGRSLDIDTDSSSDAVLRRAAKAGQGCIVLSAHVGAWQSAIAALEPFARPIRLLQYVDRNDVDRHYFEGDTKHDIAIINSRDGTAALIKLAAALRQGVFACIMGDRLTDADKISVAVPFLGGTIRVPGMPYLLASITGAKLVMCFTLLRNKNPSGVFAQEIRVPSRLSRSEEKLKPYAGTFVRALEGIVQNNPYQFFNFYDMWNDSHEQK